MYAPRTLHEGKTLQQAGFSAGDFLSAIARFPRAFPRALLRALPRALSRALSLALPQALPRALPHALRAV